MSGYESYELKTHHDSAQRLAHVHDEGVDAVDGDEGENADRTRDVSISAVEWVFQRGVVFRWPGGKGGREKEKEVEATNEKTLCDTV